MQTYDRISSIDLRLRHVEYEIQSSGKNIAGYYWVDWSSHRNVPPTAVHGGVDRDGTQIYVGRAFHEGDWIPAKVIPEKHIAYVAYGGQEHGKHEFQVSSNMLATFKGRRSTSNKHTSSGINISTFYTFSIFVATPTIWVLFGLLPFFTGHHQDAGLKSLSFEFSSHNRIVAIPVWPQITLLR